MIRARSFVVHISRGVARSSKLSARRQVGGQLAVVPAAPSSRALSNRLDDFPLPPEPAWAEAPSYSNINATDDAGCLEHERGGMEGEGTLQTDHDQDKFLSLVERAAPVNHSRTPEILLIRQLSQLLNTNGTNQPKVALNLLEEGRKNGIVNIHSYVIVTRIMARHRIADKLEDLVRQMVEEDGLTLDLNIYNNILNAYSQANMPDGAAEIYNRMLDEGITPNSLTYSNMITAYSRSHPEEMYKMLELLNETQEPATRGAYLCMVSAMWRQKDYEGILNASRGRNILERMRMEKKNPTEAAFAMGLMSAGHLGQLKAAEIIFHDRHRLGFPPKEKVYISMMLACYRGSRCAEALAYWRQLLVQDGVGEINIRPETYQLPFKAALAINDWDEMEAILDLMEERGVLSAERTFRSALGNTRSIRSLVHMERVYKAYSVLVRRGLVPTPEQVLDMAMALSSQKLFGKALPLFERVRADGVKMPQQGWESWVRSLKAVGKYDEVKKVWAMSRGEDMSQWNKEGRLLQLMIRTAQDTSDVDLVREMLDLGLKEGNAGLKVHNSAVRALIELEEPDLALEIFQMMKEDSAPQGVRPNLETYNLLLRGCVKVSRTEMALEILKEMQETTSPLLPDSQSISFVIKALVKHDRAGEVVPLFDELIRKGIRPARFCYIKVAEAALQHGDKENALKYSRIAMTKGQQLSSALEAFFEGRDGLCAESKLVEPAEGSETPPVQGAHEARDDPELHGTSTNHSLN